MIGVLKETEQTADGTAVELTNQREQLGRITEDAINIDSMLTRADRLVKVFSKRMMTDKVNANVVRICNCCTERGLGEYSQYIRGFT